MCAQTSLVNVDIMWEYGGDTVLLVASFTEWQQFPLHSRYQIIIRAPQASGTRLWHIFVGTRLIIIYVHAILLYSDSVHKATFAVPRGRHTYKFIVDGEDRVDTTRVRGRILL